MTRKKMILIIIGITVLILAGILIGYFKFFKSTPQKTVSEVQVQPTPTIELSIWEDQSEFRFSYPKELNLNPHEEDQKNYSQIELTSASNSGNLIVWVKDANVSDIDAWINKNKITDALDSTLGGIAAKKVLSGGETKKLILTTIKNDYLYQIEVNLDEGNFWNKIYEQVVSSFKFTGSQEVVVEESNTQDTIKDSLSGEETATEMGVEEEIVE